jgi:hypothetical protein
MKKHVTKAAAVLAATMSLTAQAACLPGFANDDGSFETTTMCDASSFNAKHNLKLNKDGCAAAGQTVEGSSGFRTGFVRDQQRVMTFAPVRECSDAEAAAFAVEL